MFVFASCFSLPRRERNINKPLYFLYLWNVYVLLHLVRKRTDTLKNIKYALIIR
ncbi:hypothetical protein D917_01137 [Trichinella nativa]|uniref:Uncharacterized protein n=1 Tax=Trichinella nativa TaxID=6335 RepID=A0A1Y3EXP8_9BILA|nr:hypothetical protein D917_01137 [Trichinella nativa]